LIEKNGNLWRLIENDTGCGKRLMEIEEIRGKIFKLENEK
jgi:hypothetical protein